MDWNPLNPYIVKKVVTDDTHIERFINVAPDEVLQEFPGVLQEAVQKARPGQWVRISLLYGREFLWRDEIQPMLGRQINKQMLDLAAPNNPVIVRGGFVGTLFNQPAIDEYKNHYGDMWQKFVFPPITERDEETGTCPVCYREVEQEVIYTPDDLREIYRLGLSWMGGYGVTLNSSGLYTGSAIAAYRTLDQRGQMAIRVPWTWQWRPRPDLWVDPYLPEAASALVGKGSDYLWLVGLWPTGSSFNCSTLPGTTPEVKQRERSCIFAPSTPNELALYNMIKAGGRLTGIHTEGDKDIDYMLDIIERASKDAGLTLEEIKTKRHAYDHMGMSPRPDQVQRLKNLGMMVGGYNMFLWEGNAERIFNDYGEQAVAWIQPRRSLLDAGVMSSVEIDRPIGYTDLTYFTVLHIGITRKDKNGKVWAPGQVVSREVMLKAGTIWGAYYAKKEDQLGSLESGKWADLAVLDKDYLTVPVDDIPKLRVLMTMVGGKVVHLVPSLAREIGMQPTGAQVELGGPAAQW